MFVLHKNSKKDLSSALSEGEILIDYTIDETTAYTLINRNGTEEYGDLFAVFEAEGNTWKRVYENDFKNLMPWKIDLADIDGDDFPEIMIALRKATPFDKEIKNRMFIFNYQNGILSRKWTGSKIAGIWRKFYVMDLFSAPGHELVFIEQTEDDTEKISVYSWFNFGFFMLADSNTYPKIQSVSMHDKNHIKIIYIEDEHEVELILIAANGKLLPKIEVHTE